MKFGIEVEGRLKGLRTLFMSAEEFQSHVLSSILAKHPWMHLQQVYVCDHGNELLYNNSALGQAELMGLFVTLEVTMIRSRRSYASNVGFILAILDSGFLLHPDDVQAPFPNTAFWQLEERDQIKFSTGPQGTVYCITKENMSSTHPSDFLEDITL